MSVYDEDESFDFAGRSDGAGHAGVASLDTIMQSLNKRYEIYQRRRTAMTPFNSPGDPSIPVPPTPHSILGDSAIISGGAVSDGSVAAASHPHESLKESAIFPHARPAPYWEERELYIVAEDLCCCLNGGINYRLLCEQYQRALEVLMTLVREDLRLCVSNEMEMVPGAIARSFLAKLKALLQESKRMLGEAGVNLPPQLENMIDQLPHGSSISSSNGGASQASLHAGPTPNSPMLSNGRLTGTSAGSGSVFTAPPAATNYSGNLPSLSAQSHRCVPPHRRPPSAGMLSVRTRDGEVDGGNAAAARRRPPMALPSRPHHASPDSGDLQLGHSGGGNGDGLAQRQQQQPATSSSFGHLPSVGACRNTPNLVGTVDDPVGCGGKASGGGARGGDAGGGGSSSSSGMKRSGVGCLTSLFTEATWSPKTGDRASPITSAGRTLQRQALEQLTPATVNQCTCIESMSPVPATPSSDGGVAGVDGYSNRVVEESAVGSSSAVQTGTKVLATEVHGDDENSALAAPAPLHGRLRRLQELHGEFYAMDGMALLTDALDIVFTREYDQGTAQQPKDAFTAFQQDVNEKVLPVLQSCESLQRCLRDPQPLRAYYLSSCLAHHVRPNSTILDTLKNIDSNRTVETMHLGGLHLGGRGVVAFAESVLPRLYRLRWLDLSGNDVNDSTLESLLRSLRYHPSLQHLNLSCNPLTDNALPFLLRIAQTLPQLSVLLLQSCAMKPATRQMVEAEVAVAGTCAMPVAKYRCRSKPLIRSSGVSKALTRPTAASEPLSRPPFGLPRLASPQSERRHR